MGPITLFDKSFLQSLTVDESVWFDNFFYSVICPLFYVETLADLRKPKLRRPPEQEVGIIADKFPEMHASPVVHHRELAICNLLGQDVPLTGQVPVAGSRQVKSGDLKGVVYEQSPEAKAFLRWQSREFDAIEREFASDWRAKLESLDLKRGANEFRKLGILDRNCKSLAQAKSIADTLVNGTDKAFDTLKLVRLVLDIHENDFLLIIRRWSQFKFPPPLSIFAPYAAHVLAVEAFFQIALEASLISSDRPSNRVDIAYLYYLPFCMIFVSLDKLHRQCAPLFLREDQSFIWGRELKCALSDLNEHYNLLPESEKAEGLMQFASYPPTEFESIVSEAWDRHLLPWRENAKKQTKPDPNPDLVNELKKLRNAPSLQPDMVDFDPENADVMAIRRMVQQKKGSWWLLPHDLEDNDNEEN